MGCLLIPRRLGRSAQSLGRGDRWLWRYSIANRQYSIDNRLYWLLPVATVPLSSTSALVHRLAPLCCSVCPRPRPTGPVCEGVAVGRGRGLVGVWRASPRLPVGLPLPPALVPPTGPEPPCVNTGALSSSAPASCCNGSSPEFRHRGPSVLNEIASSA
jgi:hypothetical protein